MLTEKRAPQNGCFFFRFVKFTSTHLYSVIWNQSSTGSGNKVPFGENSTSGLMVHAIIEVVVVATSKKAANIQ